MGTPALNGITIERLEPITPEQRAAALAILAKHNALDLADMLGLEASDAH